jgi:hypothetical protein
MAYIGRDIDKISNVEVLDNITFDGSSSYTLQKGGSNFTPSSANTLLVSIDGVVQAGNFTVSGSTINFGTAVSASSTCNFILHYGVGLITAPADGTVTTAKLADSSVSLAKLTATGTKDATTFLRGDNTFATAGGTNTPAFMVHKTTSQSIPNGTYTKIQFNSVKFDTDNAFDNSTNYRFTVPTGKDGKYLITAQAGFLSILAPMIFRLYLNGSAVNYSFLHGSGTTDNGISQTFLRNLSAGDYIEYYVYQASGGSKNIDTSDSTWFGAYKIIE